MPPFPVWVLLFPKMFLNLHRSTRSQYSPSVLSQNKRIIANCIKYFKKWKLCLLRCTTKPPFACSSPWITPWGGMSHPRWELAHRQQLGSLHGPRRKVCLIEAAPFGTYNQMGWIWAIVPGKHHPSEAVYEPYPASIPPAAAGLRYSEGKWMPSYMWQAVFVLAGAPQCVYNNTKLQ